MISAENIEVIRGEKEILKEVSFTAKQGELSVVLGPNGAGKSTLLRALCGSLKINDGSIQINGSNMDTFSLSELAKIRAVMLQESQLTFSFSVYEVVLLGRTPHMRGRPNKVDREIAEKALQASDMIHFKDRLYYTLSGGEKQRVQFSRALAQIWERTESEDPGFLFLDEPVSSLDLKHQHTTLELAKKLSRKNIAVIAILHDLNLALRYGDKACLMKDGRVFKNGKIQEVLQEKWIQKVFEVRAKRVQVNEKFCQIVTEL